MATLLPAQRRPLGARSLHNTTNPSPSKQARVVSGSKRARSPDHTDAQMRSGSKRVRSNVDAEETPATGAKHPDYLKDKQRKQTERAQKEAEFQRKYRISFPQWTFYIDSDNLDPKLEQHLKAKILRLGGVVDDFFSSAASHFVTAKPLPDATSATSKENKENVKSALKSPIKLVGWNAEESACSLVSKASEYGMKIWTVSKLESVLSRCLASDVDIFEPASRLPGPSAGPQRALSRLLQNEKIHGTTERDPTQKRRDYHYFTRGSCFVLVEDINQELATIAAHEYPPVKDKDSAKRPWPVLHCHPLSRNPFAPFDDKERRRYERQLEKETKEAEAARLKKEQESKLIKTLKRKAEATQSLKAAGKSNAGGANLRKSVSVSNLRRRLSHPVTHNEHNGICIDLDAEDNDMESANASGYNQSGAGMNYIAASGNSVGITSTTGTTSTSGRFQRQLGTFPDKSARHVVTSLKVSAKEKVEAEATATQMGPPSKVPDRAPLLRKSKSTNTMKLEKREEGAKPGYCESCRVKFDDFSMHVISSKHRKFATNPNNFIALDEVLERLQRRSRSEAYAIAQAQNDKAYKSCPRYMVTMLEGNRNIPL